MICLQFYGIFLCSAWISIPKVAFSGCGDICTFLEIEVPTPINHNAHLEFSQVL